MSRGPRFICRASRTTCAIHGKAIPIERGSRVARIKPARDAVEPREGSDVVDLGCLLCMHGRGEERGDEHRGEQALDAKQPETNLTICGDFNMQTSRPRSRQRKWRIPGTRQRKSGP